MDKDEVLKLAELARLEVSDEEAEGYKEDFQGILNYISTINSVEVDRFDDHIRGDTTNMMRNDDDSYESGLYTEDLLNAAPLREGDYIKVDKIL